MERIIGVLGMFFLWIQSTEAIIQQKDWQCTNYLQFSTVMKFCPEVAAYLNHYCAVGNACYARQTGQAHCDEEFCNYAKRITNTSACKGDINFLCQVLPWTGEALYSYSAKYTEPANLTKHLPEKLVSKDQYAKLYEECSTVNATISACALILNECVETNKSNKECAKQMSDCLIGVAIVDGDIDCKKEVTKICTIAIGEAVREDSKIRMMSNSLLFGVLAILSFCCSRAFSHYRFLKKKRSL